MMFTFSVDKSIDSDSAASANSSSDSFPYPFPLPLTESALSINPPPPDDPSLRRPLRILIIGDERDVVATIGILQQRGFAQRHEWGLSLSFGRSVEVIINLFTSLPERSVMALLMRYFVG